jgi:amino acid adenylation domain-containing protein
VYAFLKLYYFSDRQYGFNEENTTMDKDQVFHHLIRLYEKVAEASGFYVDHTLGTLVISGLDDPTFNILELERLDAYAFSAMLKNNKCRFMCLPGKGVDHDAFSSFMDQYQLIVLDKDVAQVYDNLDKFEFQNTTLNLTIKLVETMQDFISFDELSSISFRHVRGNLVNFFKTLPRHHFKIEGLYLFLAKLNHIPVGTIILATHDNIAGIYWVCTHPDYRKLGITSMMIQVCMDFAKQLGHKKVITQTNSMSTNLMQKLGFLPIGTAPKYALLMLKNPIQYTDAVQQREYLKDERKALQRQLTFWSERLADAPTLLELPLDKPRPSVTSPRGDRIFFTISLEIKEKLQHIENHAQATLYMVLLTAYSILLSRYSNQTDIIVGSPIANRNRYEIENLIGFFVNILPLRINLAANPSFLALLQQVKQTVSEAYGHQDLTFEQLVDHLKLEKSLSHHPLFQVTFVFQIENDRATLCPLKSVDVAREPLEFQVSRFDLTMTLTETNMGIQGEVEYATALFERATIERLIQHWQILLTGIIAQPEKKISDLPLLVPEEKHKLLVEWNNTAKDYPSDKTIHQLFEEQVERVPNNIAVLFEEKQLTYRELNEKSNQLAHYLRSLGVKPDTLVAICMERSLELVIGILAILKAGGAYVPLDPAYPEERLQFMLQDAEAAILITHSSLKDHFTKSQSRIICMDTQVFQMAEFALTNPIYINKPIDLAYVIYTSGSTGKPKGVCISHASLCNHMEWIKNAFSFTETDSVLQNTVITFDPSVAEFFLPLMLGARLVMAPIDAHKDIHLLINTIIKYRITTFKLVPTMLKVVLESGMLNQCHSLRHVLVGGEALTYDVITHFFSQVHIPLHNVYGPTEATIRASFYTHTDASMAPNHASVIGRPITNVQLYILDKNLQPTPVGVPGELYIGGMGLARGYLNQPALTAKKFIHHSFDKGKKIRLYKTGDLCRYLPDGNIEYVGRIDHQVKIRGFRIELGEIESDLKKHSAIKQVIVLAREDQPGDKRLVAYWIPKNSETIPKNSELIEYLKQILPDYMVPSTFVMMEAFPLTSSDKLDRKALPMPEAAISKAYIAPRTPQEETIAAIWAEVLHQDKIGVEDNFFELGGNSIISIQIIARANKQGLKLKVNDILQHPTIADLARVCSEVKIQAIPHEEIGVVPKHEKKVTVMGPARNETPKSIPLSYVQLNLWLARKATPKALVLNSVVRKRVAGKLDKTALEFAFQSTFKKHPILTYYISNYLPLQFPQKCIKFHIVEEDISQLSLEQRENKLLTSVENMKIFFSWKRKKNELPVIAKLFYLEEAISELQILMPHIICDNLSVKILFEDLSTYYNLYKDNLNLKIDIEPVQPYIEYIFQERDYLNGHLNQDITFWEDYLADTSATFSFPSTEIMDKSEYENSLCTTHIELTEELINRMQSFCLTNKLNLSDYICAAIGISLARYSAHYQINNNKNKAILFVKSTRGDSFDKSFGVFLRMDQIKLDMNDAPNLLVLAKRIKQSRVESESYQSCPDIVKFAACSSKEAWKNKRVSQFLLRKLMNFYTKMFKQLQLDPEVLMMFPRFFSLNLNDIPIIKWFVKKKGTQDYNVNVNIHEGFILNDDNNELFGLKLLKLNEYNLNEYNPPGLVNKNSFFFRFYRETSSNKTYLSINSILNIASREQIGKNIIECLTDCFQKR